VPHQGHATENATQQPGPQKAFEEISSLLYLQKHFEIKRVLLMYKNQATLALTTATLCAEFSDYS